MYLQRIKTWCTHVCVYTVRSFVSLDYIQTSSKIVSYTVTLSTTISIDSTTTAITDFLMQATCCFQRRANTMHNSQTANQWDKSMPLSFLSCSILEWLFSMESIHRQTFVGWRLVNGNSENNSTTSPSVCRRLSRWMLFGVYFSWHRVKWRRAQTSFVPGCMAWLQSGTQ
jgi:hypothetical protein